MRSSTNKNNGTQAKPFDSYNGGKESDGTYQKIINKIPFHNLYIEPFLGNGAIYRKKKKSDNSILIDKDASVIKKWKNISLHPGTSLINCDAIDWLEDNWQFLNISLKSEVIPFLYIDPPYPIKTRKSKKKLYKYELSDQDHIRILNVASCLKVNVLISSYPNDMYDNYLKNWNTITFQSSTRHGTATEQIWYNYEAPDTLHDYSYLGDDYRERERIKGIIFRNVTKFNKMPAVIKNAILEKITHG